MKITAPYNFVPLNKEIFYPSWADKVSHDVPFEDGESGEIKLTITAKSPIFIRNHYQCGDEFYTIKDEYGKEIKISKEFCHFKKRDGSKEFYIPASSIKGSVRNKLEIMSFGKLKIDEKKYEDKFSVRDMTDRKKLAGVGNKCGFLIKKEDKFFIENFGDIYTIEQKTELSKLNINIKNLKSAKEKYNKFGLLEEINVKFSVKNMKVKEKNIPKKVALYDLNGEKATLVFTGDINNKKNEFIFKKDKTSKLISVPVSVINEFRSVYFENEDSIDGQFWKAKFNETKKIPVFCEVDENDKIIAIGLTQIFKKIYKKSIKQAAKQKNFDAKKADLAECIFGYVSGDIALKGRVYFSHFKAIKKEDEKEDEKEEILGSPNPKYYPNYIEQTIPNKYITLMDDNATIRGWKAYPLHDNIKSIKTNDNEKITTKFKPLPKNTIFEGKIRFHNLKKAEIGALISALTFHNHKNCTYNIGMAKPLGYGKVEFDYVLNGLKFKTAEYLEEYKSLMNEWCKKHIKREWLESEQIKELFAIYDKSCKFDSLLVYQQLEKLEKKDNGQKNEKINEFYKAKKDGFVLDRYSDFTAKNNNGQKIKKSKNKNYQKKDNFDNPFMVLKIDKFKD